jgi:uncharacterized RDD family membrane protein YckC
MNAETYIEQVLDRLPAALPRREQIALELRGHIAERTADGMSEADVLRQLGDPQTLAESYLAEVPLVPGSFGQRALAKCLDGLLAVAIAVPVACGLWLVLPRELAPFALLGGILAGTFGFAAYVIVLEARTGQTLGKRALGLRVVRESGARISMGQSVVRQLPLVLEFFWVDVLFALFTERRQRAFELLSKTRVVRDWPG